MQLFPLRREAKHEYQERKDKRIPTFGVVEVQNNRGAVLDRATLRDLSINGALIQLATNQRLPETITLWFPNDRMERSATIRWRKDMSIGVEFDEPIVIPERLEHKKSRAEVVASYFKPTSN